MLTGDIRNQVDGIWNDFWAGGIANPLSVIEQITYLLFIKRLDELHTLEERKSRRLNMPMERHIFPAGSDEKGRPYDDLRWSRFKHFEPREMMQVVDEHVFPFLRSLGAEGSSYGRHMRDARLGFSSPALLAKVVEKLDRIPMDDRDTKGDVYEYMLGKIASAGQNGQFRTPRHIISLMVELMQPKPEDVICDPAAGTCGFLVEASEYVREHHPAMLRDLFQREHFNRQMFHGFDFDTTMLRIGAMNMTLHGVEEANVIYRDSLAEDHSADAGTYSLILANPPFAGSLDYEATARDLQKIVKTKKTELLFLALFLRLLKRVSNIPILIPPGLMRLW
jgi:type I restriction enzyme M protein